MRNLILGTVFLSFVLSLEAQQANSIRLYNGEYVTPEGKQKMLKLIESITANMTAAKTAPYRKFSDGTCAYTGKLLHEHFGTLPATSETNGVRIMPFGYKILDSGEEGSRLVPLKEEGEPDHKSDVYVVGVSGYSDREYTIPLVIKKVGSYRYSTVNGGSRNIPKYEHGVAITQAEYLKSFQKP